MPVSMALVEGYRSIRNVWTRLDRLNLVVGPNGSGKTNRARPPELVVISEPETSLHGRLLPALARLVVRAAGHSQVLVTTHSRTLAGEIASLSPRARTIALHLVDGETRIVDQSLVEDQDEEEQADEDDATG